jgi:hypothetical protein
MHRKAINHVEGGEAVVTAASFAKIESFTGLRLK